MPAVSNVLVVGAGVGGAAAAALLAAAGVTVDIAERKPEITAVGSGISLQGNALRVLREVGVWDDVRLVGFGYDSLGLRAPDDQGTLLAEVEDAHTGGPDLPASFGISRPLLAALLVNRAGALGATVHVDTSPTVIEQSEAGVRVHFSDDRVAEYDLVIGADGVNSTVRDLIGARPEIRSSGVGVWRVITSRPPSVVRTEAYYGGPSLLAGFTPIGPDSMYSFISEPAQDRFGMTAQEQLALVRQLARQYHGPFDDIVAVMTDESRVNYTVPSIHIVDSPWNRGRVVLIGDAAHSCPPSLAQGAAQALEDASVLAQLIRERAAVDATLWEAFMARRYGRVKMVVEASSQLNRWQRDHVQGDIAALMMQVAAVLEVPA